MSTQLYTVTLTDLGTYRVTVAAAYAEEAVRIGKTVLLEEAMQAVPELSVIKREVEATAELDAAATANAQAYQVNATYRLDFMLKVIGNDRSDALRHAKRLVNDNGGPFEFYVGDCEYGPWIIQEVQP